MNSLYDKGRESFLNGDIAWLTNNIKAVLVDGADYSPNLSTHQFLSDIPAIGRVATSANFASKNSAAGVADAGDITFTTVTGDTSEYIAIYQDTGVAGTSRLIGLIDTATNLPITPNGGDINVSWDNGANRIFKL